jgi:N6-L-threonylcarbamoyladenine synthase
MRLSRCRPLIAVARSAYREPVCRELTVLALESSADDSCASIVNSERKILSNVVIKQHHLNVKHGGIHPLEAQHAHERNVVSTPPIA